MQTIKIIGLPLTVKEFKGQRVVTFKDIETLHQRPEGTGRKRFSDNIKHFIEGVDYYRLSMSEIRTLNLSKKFNYPKGLIVLTETGYLMLVKSFTDNLAWSVQRALVTEYFKSRKQAALAPATPAKPEKITLDTLGKRALYEELKENSIALSTLVKLVPTVAGLNQLEEFSVSLWYVAADLTTIASALKK
jgi:hypothetical protein